MQPILNTMIKGTLLMDNALNLYVFFSLYFERLSSIDCNTIVVIVCSGFTSIVPPSTSVYRKSPYISPKPAHVGSPAPVSPISAPIYTYYCSGASYSALWLIMETMLP